MAESTLFTNVITVIQFFMQLKVREKYQEFCFFCNLRQQKIKISPDVIYQR